jgi:excinuclease UvrABC helicase subunit UvrB
MARGKKSSALGRNEFLFSGRKHQVAIPETNLCVLKNDHRDQKRIVIQACWSSFRIFHSYNAIIDPMIDCLALVSKPIAVKAAKYQVADIIIGRMEERSGDIHRTMVKNEKMSQC